MDLNAVQKVRVARTRDELTFAPGDVPLGGGTWLYSEPQDGVTGLVDLTALGWESLAITDDTLSIAATCTLAELSKLEAGEGWLGHPLIWQCCTSLLGSFKVWNTATVGGNIALALPAAPMIALTSTLDAVAVVWNADGVSETRTPIVDFVTGAQSTMLRHGDVIRSIEVPLRALRSRSGFRRISLSPLGRTATLVTVRDDRVGAGTDSGSGEVVFTVTGGTVRPRQFRFDELPSAAALEQSVLSIDDWHSDAHGAPDWRRAMSALFAEELRIELGGSV
jgi:CO/xanthine dehydrogenase FAD-binding subunit